MKKQTLAQFLTYGGLIPFLGSIAIPFIYPDFLGLNYDHIILTYGAVIASFIAGIHWGIYLFKETPINLFIHSNIAALLAWFAVLADIPGSPGILLICFFYLLFIDKQLSNAGIIEDWYMRMRLIASVIVILALGVHVLFQ
jgi:hypothetical protein